MSRTICIVPWSNLVIAPDGRATFCCDAPVPLRVGGRIGSVYKDSLEDLWNAPEIVEVRAAMARGEKPETCRVCWEREAAGGTSRRLTTNAIYRYLGGRLSVDTLRKEGAETGFKLDRKPDWFTLELGNACDLKCRSCNPLFSSRIAADRVHAAWADEDDSPQKQVPRPLRIVPEKTTAWFDDIDALADMISAGAAGNAVLSLIGGEPLLADRPTDRIWRLLSALVERGVARNLFLGITTNAQHRSQMLEKLAPLFRGVSLALSVDAHGRLFEYLRHGASWSKLIGNLPWFRQLSNVQVIAIPTLQNLNVLGMVKLLRFLDAEGLLLGFNALNWPARLRPANLPPKVRRIAAERLRRYLETECNPANFEVVRGYCETLEDAEDSFDLALFREFMTFTNDLDADRGENIREVAPELVALVRAAGIEWSAERRQLSARANRSVFSQPEAQQRINQTISPRDVIFPGYESAGSGTYLKSGLEQLARIDSWLLACGCTGLGTSGAVADFGSHYGRITRALRAGLPHATVYSFDIDPHALEFCRAELGATPVVTGWSPDEEPLTALLGGLDAVICVSLLTHTPLEHWRSVLRAWTKMLRPGGIAAFTFLSQSYLESWQAGKMQNYGTYSREQQAAIIRSIDQEGFGFAALTATYGDAPFYGIAMAKRDIVSREVTAAGLELLAIPDDAPATFGQDLALVRKPGVQRSRPVQVSHSSAEVSVVAFYDPRCYAPREDSEGDHTASLWARLLGKKPAGPLPSELGFADPRIPEVREAQASLAKEHGIDAFCYLYYWNGRPRWDSAWRDLVTTDRPDFPFCFLVTIQGDELLTPSSAMRLIQDILPALRDHRYLRLEGRPLVIVSDVTRMTEPRTIARSWRAAAQRDGIGELHLSAAEPVAADCPEDLGFDSFLQGPASGDDQFGLVAEALVRPWPHHRFFRTIRHKWDPSDPQSCHLYEHWLRSAFEAARRPGENLVFIDSWNDWLGGCYLEPDDRNGRAALLATRRATLGPASGPVLLRQLRESLRGVNAHLEPVLEELAHVLSLRDDASVRLIATVEAALCRNQEATTEPLREITVASRQLPSSPGRFSLDRVDNIIGADLYDREDPVFVSNVEVCLAGWCHAGDEAPDNVDLFLALESTIRTGSGEDLIFRVTDRIPRPDVASAIPGYPPNCGFESTVNLTCMKPGLYRVALVQRTPRAAYRDATPTIIRIEPKSCSSD